jgi:UDP-glucose 4-epimerase
MNCGYGHGASVRDVIASMERVTGHKLPVKESPRRPGDPPWLVADARKIREILGWQPKHDDLDEIVASAYAWEQRLNASG